MEFSVQSNEFYTWKVTSYIILIKFIYSVSFLMLKAEMWLQALPYHHIQEVPFWNELSDVRKMWIVSHNKHINLSVHI